MGSTDLAEDVASRAVRAGDGVEQDDGGLGCVERPEIAGRAGVAESKMMLEPPPRGRELEKAAGEAQVCALRGGSGAVGERVGRREAVAEQQVLVWAESAADRS